tara:strand:+ start:713 stop:1312 length:600 start_codon:yes stop_codon:yes gene_type:complete
MAIPTLDDDKESLKKERRAANAALWKKANPEKNRAIAARWRKNNPEKNTRLKAEWNEKNPGHAARKAKEWRTANPEKWKAGARKNQLKTLSNPEGRLNHNIRSHMLRCLSKTTETISQLKHSLPYTMSELRIHIERQFIKGMSWDNRSEWHVDHIIPLSSFKFTSSSDPEFQAAWALSNLRPLWAKENIVKNKKRTLLL